MNKKQLTLAAIIGLVAHNSIFAFEIANDIEDFDINTVEYIEEEEIIDLGFDTANYLPEGFNPYEFFFDFETIPYIEDECIELGFPVGDYLPEGFNAFSDPKGVEGIVFIEEEEIIDVGFDTSHYLSADFDPYKRSLDINTIEYIEEQECIDLGFDPRNYLPKNFDAYNSISL